MPVSRRDLLFAMGASSAMILGCAGGGSGQKKRKKVDEGGGGGGGGGKKRSPANGPSRITLKVGGREYDLFHPNPANGGSMPLVLAFHGGGANKDNMMRNLGVTGADSSYPWMVAAPMGSCTGLIGCDSGNWNSGHSPGGLKQGADDVAHARAVLADVRKRYQVDAKRVFATGFSNGAMMCYRLAAEMSDELAAIAFMAGTIGGSEEKGAREHVNDPAKSTRPVSILHMHGSKDRSVQMAGGQSQKSDRIDISTVDSLKPWVAHNRTKTAVPRSMPSGLWKSDGGREGSAVWCKVYEGHTHNWHPENVDLMARFFESHHR